MYKDLAISIATRIIIPKTQYSRNVQHIVDISTIDIINQISEQFDISLYDVQETKEHVLFELKDEITKMYLYDFFIDHLSYDDTNDYFEYIDQIRNMGTLEVIDYISNEDFGYVYFKKGNLRECYLFDDLKIQLDCLFFFFPGHFELFDEENAFKYLHHILRLSQHNPLVNTTFISQQ